MNVGDFLPVAVGGLGEELQHVGGGLLLEGLGQALALGHQLVDPGARRHRIGMPVLDEGEQPRNLALDLGGCSLQLVARAPSLRGHTLALVLVGRDGRGHDVRREQIVAQRREHALLDLGHKQGA
jgi:hypothetical protein